ncbi:MAG TPA: kynureninase [Acidimicrobiia bacterium]|nr:kynureninase [Acidimicrobiia bacterium]
MSTFDLGPFPEASGFEAALELDHSDPLGEFRKRYVFTDSDLIYLDGNSLGRLPATAPTLVDRVVRNEWGDRLIRSWNDGWWDMQLEIGERLAPLLGAAPGVVIISDSTSVNLYKLATAAMRARPGRTKIVTDDTNFPTDVYVLRGVAEAHGATLHIIPIEGESEPAVGLEGALDESTALVSLSHTAFKTGFTHDLARVTGLVHQIGALVLWDLSHSVGVVPLDLESAGADLAVGCTYKYLNGGPGSPAFLYVRRELQGSLANPIIGWWGHADPFAFDLDFRPAEGIRKFHTGTMPVLSLATIDAGLGDVTEAGIDRLRAKSVSLTEFFVDQWEEYLEGLGFALESPRDPAVRGSHVSLSHPDAWPIDRALIEIGKVIPDFRAPDNLRFGLAPLYNSHLDVHTAIQRIKTIVESGELADFEVRDVKVT